MPTASRTADAASASSRGGLAVVQLMLSNAIKVGEISPGDLRLLQRVQQLVEQANISQNLLQFHFTEEYRLTPTREIRLDGGIWEELPGNQQEAPSS